VTEAPVIMYIIEMLVSTNQSPQSAISNYIYQFAVNTLALE